MTTGCLPVLKRCAAVCALAVVSRNVWRSSTVSLSSFTERDHSGTQIPLLAKEPIETAVPFTQSISSNSRLAAFASEDATTAEVLSVNNHSGIIDTAMETLVLERSAASTSHTSATAKSNRNDWAALIQASADALEAQCPPRPNDTGGAHPNQQYRYRPPLVPRVFAPLIIAGAQKAGTTALFYLLQHVHNMSSASMTTTQRPNNQQPQSPDVVLLPSRRLETHFFDQAASNARQEQQQLSTETTCRWRHKYSQEFDWTRVHTWASSARHPSNVTSPPLIVTLEKCPVYTCKPRIPYHIHQVVPHAKIVLILRNPIERLYSHWYMMKGSRLSKQHRQGTNSTGGLNTDGFDDFSLEDTIQTELSILHWIRWSTAPLLDTYQQNYSFNTTQSLHHLFLIPSDKDLATRSGQADIGSADYHARKRNHQQYGYLSRGMYAPQIYNWLNASFALHEQLLVIRYEYFVSNRISVLNRIADFVGLPRHETKTVAYDVLDRDYSPRQDGSRTGGIRRQRDDAAAAVEAINSSRNSQTKKVPLPPMDPVVREYLAKFYKPYNDELADLLGEEWRDVWS